MLVFRGVNHIFFGNSPRNSFLKKKTLQKKPCRILHWQGKRNLVDVDVSIATPHASGAKLVEPGNNE